MKIAVLGTGRVGQTLGKKLLELGHEVRMGSRSADGEKVQSFATSHANASAGTFVEAAALGELALNCTAGVASLDALVPAKEALAGKVLVDVANPLDFSQGMPPRLSVCNDDSLGEQLQAALSATKVVKALNTMSCEVMVEPSRVPGAHDVFVCGVDDEAKSQVRSLLQSFGWDAARILDLGGIAQARGTEMWLPLWVRLWGALGTSDFNLAVVRA